MFSLSSLIASVRKNCKNKEPAKLRITFFCYMIASQLVKEVLKFGSKEIFPSSRTIGICITNDNFLNVSQLFQNPIFYSVFLTFLSEIKNVND